MITPTPALLPRPGSPLPPPTWTERLRHQRDVVIATTIVTVGCAAVLLLLLSVNHTTGGEVDGPSVAGYGIVVGLLSLTFLLVAGRHRLAFGILVVLWILLAVSGVDGYAEHAKAVTSASADQRQRPALAPLVFTGFGIIGGGALVVGYRRTRGATPGTDAVPARRA
jgi:hypothetical protein